jgi:hypothetical protein
VSNEGERLLYCDHVENDGEDLFRLACEHDLRASSRKRSTRRICPNRRQPGSRFATATTANGLVARNCLNESVVVTRTDTAGMSALGRVRQQQLGNDDSAQNHWGLIG